MGMAGRSGGGGDATAGGTTRLPITGGPGQHQPVRRVRILLSPAVCSPSLFQLPPIHRCLVVPLPSCLLLLILSVAIP
eukprot:763407-Hanusia_phi.AAC.2